MASSGNGLNSRMPNVASTVVAPSARYHVDPAELAQAEVDRPVGPITDCSTTPSAPSSSTTAAAHGATIRSPSRTSTLERSSITSGATAVWPSVEYAVSDPSIGVSPAFSTLTKPLPVAWSAGAGTPGQNHDDDSGDPAGTTGMGGTETVP